MKLFTKLGANPKILKSDKAGKGYLSLIMHLAPSDKSGYDTCPFASPGCKAACLNTSGHGRYQRTQEARIRKTKFFFENREAFMFQLIREISNFQKYCQKRGVNPAIRLNGTSDIAWESVCPALFKMFPNVQFYDYTKDPSRVGNTPFNYDLTFSRDETNRVVCKSVFANGGRIAIVYKKIPSYATNGDKTDLRFLDPSGIVGVKAKGRAKHDKSGFVV